MRGKPGIPGSGREMILYRFSEVPGVESRRCLHSGGPDGAEMWLLHSGGPAHQTILRFLQNLVFFFVSVSFL